MIIIQISKICIEDILGQSLKVVLLSNLSLLFCYVHGSIYQLNCST